MTQPTLITTRNPWRSVPRLVIPVFAEETMTLMVTWTDWWLCGRFLAHHGDSVKAAMGLMGYTMWLIPSMFAAVAIGATALVARYVGGQDYSRAERAANQAIQLGLLFAVVLTLATYFGGSGFIRIMQLRGDAADFAELYLAIIVAVIPLIMIEQVGAAILRGAGDMVTGFVAKTVVVIVNITLSYSLITGWGPFPQLGWTGLAVGTATGHAVGGTIILLVLLRGRAGMRLSRNLFRTHFELAVKLIRIGGPGGLDMAALLFSQMVFVAIVNSLGVSAAAAHGLAIQIEACAYLPGHAFQVAAATMTGQYLGARQPDRAAQSAWYCFLLGCAFMTSAGVAMYLGGPSIAYFFTGDWDDPTTHLAGELVQIVAWAMPALAFQMIISGALRGAGDTVWPLVFTLFGLMAVRIPLAVFLAHDSFLLPLVNWELPGLNWGVYGAWYAMVCDLFVRAMLTATRFIQGGWKSIHV